MDRLCFFSRSSNKAPGRGAQERVANLDDYAELATIPHWRRILSNFYEFPFEYKGRQYRTVEHAYQAQKMAYLDGTSGLAAKFEIGGEWDGAGAVARKHRKAIMASPDVLSQWEPVMERILRAKFEQCPEFRRVLRCTGRAELWHIRPRQPLLRVPALESIRKIE